ncbi:MAG: methyltransferase domain-containing protein [Mesorhizobium sp.]|uniref:class I SAM-dependent methyltransferase n=1 Tax=Mesorhizobium sp. TaxID=1871066 RepID=UPI000FE326F9|nr:class I SAM-dependent methyltransferase [Mesorhizobium sp.]RWK23429.1 MAG: class I SAM-dependent methyltransferase [Mesorhizobium sp.]RWK30982.1 MAG: class I SAM-dependent methyltransferase [Mesorhizobium sp.]TIQ42584.1 MAG: methyltransferase domain-containing protein [Mesorhizobium sp.]
MSRDWENWDVGGIANEIHTIWQNSPIEDAHRQELVDIVSGYAASTAPSILEVGCGTGLIYQKLISNLPTGASYIGVDSSLKMLDIARRGFPEGEFLFGDGYGLVFKDQEFDVVLCFEVLGHIPEIGQFIAELLRVTRKICIFTTWPSDGHEVVENYETIGGVQFLHRRYSDAFVRKTIKSRALKNLSDIESVSLRSGGQAYIVTCLS